MRCSPRFATRYGLSDYDAGVLVADPSLADYYEATTIAATGVADPKTVANWISGELFRLLKESGQEIGAAQVSPQALAGLIGLVQDGTINMTPGPFLHLFKRIESTDGGEAISKEQKGRLFRGCASRNDRVKGSYLVTAKLPCILIFVSICGIIVPGIS